MSDGLDHIFTYECCNVDQVFRRVHFIQGKGQQEYK